MTARKATRPAICALLLVPALWGSGCLALGEWHYARGMAAVAAQDSIYHLTLAGEAYPFEFKFRTAQAMQLFELARRLPEVAMVAHESLSRAVAVDPHSVELVSKLMAVQRGLGWCGPAQSTADRLVRLAPLSEKAKSLASLPCGGTPLWL